MDKTEDIIATARKYAELVKASNLPIQIDKAYLFGSFAKGTPRKDSDIDIAFVVSNWKGGYFDTVVPIWRLRRNIDTRIEPHIIDPEEDYAYFLREVQRTGIELSV
jgi:predicted nucleotidyltransferase